MDAYYQTEAQMAAVEEGLDFEKPGGGLSFSSAVDMIPVVGGLKMWYELGTGFDMFTGQHIETSDWAQVAMIGLNFLPVTVEAAPEEAAIESEANIPFYGLGQIGGEGAGTIDADGGTTLFWHGSQDAVANRQAMGITVDGPGNGGMYWATSRQIDELGPLNWTVGGNANVQLFPPALINKGGIEATYTLSPSEASLFQPAWGPDFSWNPYQWWKGAFGQYYYNPTAVTWGTRAAQLGTAGAITGAGIGGAYLINQQITK